jgi:hypothetical protein
MSSILAEIKKGDKGSTIEIVVQKPTDPALPLGAKSLVQLNLYSTIQFEFEQPSGKRLALVTASIKSMPVGADGIATYTDNTGIFTSTSRWKVRPVLTTGGGSIFKGSWIGFSVSD